MRRQELFNQLFTKLPLHERISRNLASEAATDCEAEYSLHKRTEREY